MGTYKPVFVLPVKFNDGFVDEPTFNVNVPTLLETVETAYTFVPSQIIVSVWPWGTDTVEPVIDEVLKVNEYDPLVEFST